MTDLSTAAQTALRAIRLIRQYDLATSAEAERTVLQSLSAQDMAACVVALSDSESSSSLSPTERVNHILDRLVISRSAEFQTYTDKIIRLREANPELELSTDPKQIRRQLELQYKERTRDFCRALIHAGLSDNVIAGLWPIFERSEKNTDRITRSIRQLGKTMVMTSNDVARFELSDTNAVLAHIEATFDDLEIVDINSLPKDTYRRTFETRDAVIQYLRESGVLEVPEINICLTAVQSGFVIDLTALEIHPEVPLPPAPGAATEIAISVVKRWKYANRTEEEDNAGLTEDQLTKKLIQALRAKTASPETQTKFEMLCQVADRLLSFVPADVIKTRWFDIIADYAVGDDPMTFEQVLASGEELKTVLDYWKILQRS